MGEPDVDPEKKAEQARVEARWKGKVLLSKDFDVACRQLAELIARGHAERSSGGPRCECRVCEAWRRTGTLPPD